MKIIADFFRSILIFFGEIILLILLLEGLCSFALSFTAACLTSELSATRYDEFLGWVSRPDIQERNMFGPGLSFRTNAQSFRNAEIFDPAVPKGKIRIICSGDAFTQGHGVDNDHAWPAQFATLDWRLQVVNMGQAGFGLDQSYLRYIRDGLILDHKMHIFALTAADFSRVKNSKFLGIYDKPVVTLEKGNIRVENVPVPGSSFWAQRWRDIARVGKNFRTYELVSGLSQKLVPRPSALSASDLQDIKEIALALFADMHKKIMDKKGKLVIVFLPRSEDYYRDDTDALRFWLRMELKARGIVMIDLVDEVRKLPIRDYKNFFRGHYSEAGNRFVAQYLYKMFTASGDFT
ncbi:MAG: hypothetical protein UY62_C0065G0003 [Parcubacteria group bacterium GW2011_GWF2_50_9]|nr:MAG: hypothetical protein UY62_C0065G0003 [Parcubacteria group bacterium GW2011_GWF2_50_9]